MKIKDRIKELRRVKADELRPNPKNWRKHPRAQKEALRGLLAEVGYADALLARELDDGSLMLLDGHLRAEITPDTKVPVLVLDVTEEEGDKILATLDPLAALAKADDAALKGLLDQVETDSEAVREMLDGLVKDKGGAGQQPGAELEISPELFERHDYIVIYFDNELDWHVATEALGVKTVLSGQVGGTKFRHKGIGRVLSAAKLLELIQK